MLVCLFVHVITYNNKVLSWLDLPYNKWKRTAKNARLVLKVSKEHYR